MAFIYSIFKLRTSVYVTHYQENIVMMKYSDVIIR